MNLNAALMCFNNRLRQGQAQTDSLHILGKAAAVKALEDMIQILRVDAAACVFHRDLGQTGRLLPPDQNTVPLGRMVQGVFDQIPDRLCQPGPVTDETGLLVPLQVDLFSFLLGGIVGIVIMGFIVFNLQSQGRMDMMPVIMLVCVLILVAIGLIGWWWMSRTSCSSSRAAAPSPP